MRFPCAPSSDLHSAGELRRCVCASGHSADTTHASSKSFCVYFLIIVFPFFVFTFLCGFAHSKSKSVAFASRQWLQLPRARTKELGAAPRKIENICAIREEERKSWRRKGFKYPARSGETCSRPNCEIKQVWEDFLPLLALVWVREINTVNQLLIAIMEF